MAEMIVLGSLAAFGAISAVWVCLGWLLPGGKGMALVCSGEPDEGIRCRVQWLRSLGLLSGPFLVITEAPPDFRQSGDIEYCRPEALLSRLEQERIDTDGTGNGDSSGHHRRGGVPEL